MGEAVKTVVKAPETKKENQVSQVQKGNFYQPISSPVEQILFLQRTIGNQAVQRLMRSGALQAKLRIGAPGDVYEQEADRAAEQVMRMPEPKVSENDVASAKQQIDAVQRKGQQCTGKPLSRSTKEDKEGELQAKEIPGSTPEVTQGLEASINAVRSGGAPLSESERAFFEPRFGHDFSGVRVHTEAKAVEAARALNARAFTVGRDVVFGAGEYAPATGKGRHLMAHELTHVIQKSAQICNSSVQLKSAEEITYAVKPGDDLIKIAMKFGVAVEDLKLKNTSKLKNWPTPKGIIQGFNAGETIIIPSSSKKTTEEKNRQTPEEGMAKSINKTKEFFREKATAFWNKVTSLWGETSSFWGKIRSIGEAESIQEDKAAEKDETSKEDENSISYKSQRDNVYKKGGISGENMCNVTTLAMQIETLARSQEKAKEAVIALLKKNGDSTDENELRKQQLEDLIMRRFELMGDGGWKNLDGKKPFYKGWYDAVKESGRPWHQQSLALNYVAMEFSDIVGKAEHTEASAKLSLETILSSKYFKDTLRPALKKGATVMLSTKLTGGHIVLLAEVDEDGAVINDPYGMLLASQGSYIKNGMNTKQALDRIRDKHDLVKQRLKFNKGLWDTLQDSKSLGSTLPQNMGERNFYTWDEVKKYEIGKWNNILYGKSK